MYCVRVLRAACCVLRAACCCVVMGTVNGLTCAVMLHDVCG